MIKMADFASHTHQPTKSVTYTRNRCCVETSWGGNRAHRRPSDTLMDTYSPAMTTSVASFSSDSGSESGYLLSPRGSFPASPRTPVSWPDAPKGGYRETRLASTNDTGKRKHGSHHNGDSTAGALPGVHDILVEANHDHCARDVSATRPKRRLITPLSSPETALSEIGGPDDPITRSLNYGRRPEKGLLSRPTGLGDANIRFPQPSCQVTAPHASQSVIPYPRQQPSPPREEARKGRAKPKGAHCNVKYLPEEQDFIRYHKIDLKESWNEVMQSFKLFQQRFPKEELDRRIQGLQGVHYRENYAIPKPRRETNGRHVCFLPNGHVLAHACKVREQGEYKYMYGLVYLFPERAMDYIWVRPDHSRFAAELNNERIQAREQAKRDAMARGTWVEKLEDNSCICCETEDADMAAEALQAGHLCVGEYRDGSAYDPR